MNLNYFLIKLLKIKKRIFLDLEYKKFIKIFGKRNHYPPKEKDVVIIELVEGNYPFFNTFLLLKNKNLINKNVVGLWTFCLQREHGLINILKFFINFSIQFLIKKKWEKMYKSIGINKIYFLNNDLKNNFFVHENNFIKKNLKIKKKEKILKITYNKIKVGDLIYDHYLRFFGKTTFQTNDIYSFKKILNYTKNMFDNLLYIKKELGNNIKYYITQQTPYLQHGIPLRFFLKNKITVIGGHEDMNSYIKKYTQQWPFDNRDIYTIRSKFKKLNHKNKKIQLARKILNSKFRGKKVAELFQIKNPYINSKKKIENIDLIIFLPGFDDAPHCYGNHVFSDFHEWIYETLMFLLEIKIKVAIKPHPFTTWKSQVFIEKLKNKFSHIIWLDKSTSNKNILKKRPSLCINPYGTILHEMAFNKVIPIATGANPYVSYNFVFTPKTKKEYFKFLKLGINKKLKLPNNYKREILEWYYMYYLHNDDFFENFQRKLKLKSITPIDHEAELKLFKLFNKKYLNILKKLFKE